MPQSGIAGSHGNSTFFFKVKYTSELFSVYISIYRNRIAIFQVCREYLQQCLHDLCPCEGDRWEHLTLRMLLIPYGAPAEQNVDELKLAEGSGEAGAWLPLWWLSYSVSCVPLLLQRKLPADSRVLEASELVYTVSAQEYWQRALLTEEETGN